MNFRKTITSLCILILATFIITSCASQEVTSTNQNINVISEHNYFVDISFEGGTGKAYIKSPVEITDNNGKLSAKFVWSSSNYDYMIVNGQKYENENNGGESTFTVDIDNIDEPLTVIGDTVAMSVPHEIEYTITWGEKHDGNTSVEENLEAENESSPVGENSEAGNEEPSTRKDKNSDAKLSELKAALEDAGLSFTGKTELKYATGFEIEKYGDYSLISIDNSGNYLVLPEGSDEKITSNILKKAGKDVVILQKPLDKTYLVSTSAMDLINTCGALDMVKLSGTKKEDWYIDAAKDAMQDGKIIYAGKYRAPDYEVILGAGCNFAIENTMIYHEPAVKEKLTELGIPVLVETSSYEEHPLGRLEWIKLYGALFDREKEAEQYFDDQLGSMSAIMDDNKKTGKTVAFFHVTANGLINVRKSGDYITRMIELSGGKYALLGAGEGENALSTMNMQMEDFYREAALADIIIYNSTIGGEIHSIDDLIAKNKLFSDFKAVKEKRVYCTERNLFQQITGMAEFLRDLSDVLSDVDRDYTYLNKLS
ncbi:ABC transporter substrate-binding protein [Butyrivibrio sp. LC3010]|uniref:ABC transporter substrate-binding protein n=1 Tax=Butyrivibrio sp. LC3010 TaxID=1280680 RepID=UPI00040681EC|nr:ABC transporter substrate-binding protein [Butyrivibrio sp. LC3010]